MDAAQKINAASLAEKEKYFRFEKISEVFTYLGIFGGLALTFLPNQFKINRPLLYILLATIFVCAFCWFRLLPKKYTGLKKTLIYYFASIIFVFAAVHFTGGIQSFTIFFFYLTVLGASAALRVRWFLVVIGSIVFCLVFEAAFFGSALFFQRLTLAAVHIWALLIIALYSKFIFDNEKNAESREESSKLRAAKQLDIVKNEFVFVISNKLKQPILGLQNYLDTAIGTRNSSWSADFTDLLSKTRENSQRLSSLVNDLSDLSRIESQNLKLDLKPVNLNQLIGSTLSDFSMVASEKDINLTYQPNPETIIVKADSSRLHEILANLIDNAIKYSPKNSNVSVHFGKEALTAKIQIADNGFGIPKEAQEHLFEKFYRVNRSASEPKGTGLGLFVTKELIDRQGGKIWFDSLVGKGTTFYFTLPLVA